MPLHRLTVPTYPGGLPGTHDYINNPALNGDIGAPATADAKKGAGPNEGTYFVAFGENATSNFTNRGMSALAQNTDYLDDVVHRDLAIPAVGAVATPGAPLASVTIPGIEVFVGAIGTPLDQRSLSGLISVVDNNGIPMHVLSGNVYVPILVSAITDGVSNVVGVPADGFYTAPTVEFSIPIPAGQSYRLVYYKRSNVVDQEAGMLSRFNDGVRGIEDLWALATNTLLGVATFESGKFFNGGAVFNAGFTTSVGTFGIFNGEARFNDLVLFDTGGIPTFNDQVILGIGLDKEIPKVLSTPFSGSAPTLMYEQSQSGVSNFYRVYLGGGGGWTGSSFVVTVNARWDEGPDVWVPDSINDAATRVVLDLSGGAGVKNHKADPLPASWVDADWDAGADDTEYTYGGGYGPTPLSAVVRRANKTHKVPFLDTFNSTLFTAFDYEWFARFSLAFGDRSSMWYSPYKEADDVGAGNKDGVSITNNCEWDAVDVRFERQVGTRPSVQLVQNPDDGFLLRKKLPLPTTPSSWLDNEWDIEGSLRGMQLGNWSVATTNAAIVLECVAARPRTATRPEIWVYGLSSVAGEFMRGNSATGDFASFTTHASSDGNAPRQILWDETAARFYALLATSGKIDESVDGGLTWSEAGDLGGGAYDQFLLDDTGAVVAIDIVSNTVRQAASVGGVYSDQVTGANNSLDLVFCHRSSLWVLGSTVNFGTDSGIYTSSDRVTWTPVAISGTALQNGQGSFRLAYNAERNVVAAFGRTDENGIPIVLRSPDGGTTWERVEPLPDLFDVRGTAVANAAPPSAAVFVGGRFVVIRLSPDNGSQQVIHGSADGLQWKVAFDFGDTTTPATPAPLLSAQVAATEKMAAFIGGGNENIAHSMVLA